VTKKLFFRTATGRSDNYGLVKIVQSQLSSAEGNIPHAMFQIGAQDSGFIFRRRLSCRHPRCTTRELSDREMVIWRDNPAGMALLAEATAYFRDALLLGLWNGINSRHRQAGIRPP